MLTKVEKFDRIESEEPWFVSPRFFAFSRPVTRLVTIPKRIFLFKFVYVDPNAICFSSEGRGESERCEEGKRRLRNVPAR